MMPVKPAEIVPLLKMKKKVMKKPFPSCKAINVRNVNFSISMCSNALESNEIMWNTSDSERQSLDRQSS